ncbi:type I-E CRISPR-associated protein Cas6/Cse3/CasE [Kocuria rhizophila]|uniref:type I-E CRISPR-associated protein Cas6/Cse3/CasE n=1 Tax=Kocuria rhizophila TaxID=72000 RepID=UPI0038794A1B
MFFSRIQLNPQRREARKLLANPRAMHAAVEACFPPAGGNGAATRNLWRLDSDRAGARLYLVSPAAPDMRHLVENAGWESSPAETTDYDRFLDGLMIGQEYSFRVTVNPVKRQFVPGGRGKLLPHLTEEQQLGWFTERASGWGFEPLKLPGASEGAPEATGMRVIQRHDRNFSKHEDGARRMVTQRQVTVAGRLEVTSAELLRTHLTEGMGRGKAYGCGLMTLARAR